MDLPPLLEITLPDYSAFNALRPLAFRAWHIPTERMLALSGFTDQLVYPKPDAEGSAEAEPLPLIDCLLMQFTGRHDRAGVPIWEGDIVQLKHDLGEGRPPAYYHQFVAYWRGGFVLLDMTERADAAPLSPLVYERLSDLASEPIDCLIVGNVYQDPHLLAIGGLIVGEISADEGVQGPVM